MIGGSRAGHATTQPEGTPIHPDQDNTYDPAVRKALGPIAVRVDHVGSTAVLGPATKPIIDIQVSVPDIAAVDSYRLPLERLGYLFVPIPESPDFHFFGKPAARPRRFRVHVCQVASEHEARHPAVRDYLRFHPDEAAAYAALKREIAARHPGDRLAYIAERSPYVEELERRAVAWCIRDPANADSRCAGG